MVHLLDLKKLRKGIHPIEIEAGERALKEPYGKTAPETGATEREHTVYLSWETEEYEHLPKENLWFVALGIVTILAAVVAIFMQNYFFALFIVVAGLTVAVLAKQKPRKVRLSVTSDGLEIGNRLYNFDDLSSFWVFFDPPLFKELSVESKKIFMPYIRAPLGETDPEKIREILLKFLPEEKQNESFISLLSRVVGF